MAARGLHIDDILKAQQRYVAQGDPIAKESLKRLESLQQIGEKDLELSHQDRLLQTAQLYKDHLADIDDDKIIEELKEGLLDTKGDGLNANVIKLTDIIKNATLGGGVEGPVSNAAEPIQKMSAEVKEQTGTGPKAEAPQLGGFGSLVKEIKGLGKLEKWFDISKGSNQGFLGRVVSRKVAENRYVEDEMAADPTKDPKMFKQQLKQEFSELQKTLVQKKEVELEIERLEGRGFTKEDPNLAALYEKQQVVQAQQETFDSRLRVQKTRRSQEAERAQEASQPSTQTPSNVVPFTQKTEEVRLETKDQPTPFAEPVKPLQTQTAALLQASPVVPVSVTSPALNVGAPSPVATPLADNSVVADAPPAPVFTSEEEAETLRVQQQELTLLQQIESNTRPQPAQPQAPASAQPAAAPTENKGGGILSSALSAASLVPGPIGAVARTAKAVSGFFGSRAVGGPVDADKPYLVGEKGPEVVVPETAGEVIPSGDPAVIDMGDGVRKTVNSDGSYSISDGGGVRRYDASGALTESQSPTFARYSETTKADGSLTQDYTAGPMSVSQTKDASGSMVAESSSYDLGLAKVSQQSVGGEVEQTIEARAVGGPVDANKPYVVGERGPEVVVPEKAGKVIPSGEPAVIDMGNGVRKIVNSDGSYSISDGGGVRKYDASGSLVESQSPTLGGYSETTKADGTKTQSYNAGPMSVSQTKDASGSMVAESSSYDLGSMKVSQQSAGGKIDQSAVVRMGGEADMVYNQSGENAGMAQQTAQAAQQPVVINAPTTVSQTSNYAGKSPPRNTESSYQSYNKSKFAY